MQRILPALRALLFALAVPALAGCGLKGDLYLPENGAAPPAAEDDESPPDDEPDDEPDDDDARTND